MFDDEDDDSDIDLCKKYKFLYENGCLRKTDITDRHPLMDRIKDQCDNLLSLNQGDDHLTSAESQAFLNESLRICGHPPDIYNKTGGALEFKPYYFKGDKFVGSNASPPFTPEQYDMNLTGDCGPLAQIINILYHVITVSILLAQVRLNFHKYARLRTWIFDIAQLHATTATTTTTTTVETVQGVMQDDEMSFTPGTKHLNENCYGAVCDRNSESDIEKCCYSSPTETVLKYILYFILFVIIIILCVATLRHYA